MRRTTRLSFVLLAGCLVLLAACGRQAATTPVPEQVTQTAVPQPPTKGEVLVYVAGPLSGFQANAGQTVLGGARLAADQINRNGGLLGYEVTVIGLDDQSDSDVAVAVAEEIKAAIGEGKKVLGVIGHLNSGQTLAAMEIYKDLPLVVITPTSSEVSLTQKAYRNFFRANANDAAQAKVDAGFLVNTLHAKRVAVIHNDDPYGVGLALLMTNELQALGAQPVTNIQVAVEQSTYDQEVQQIAAVAPDAVFYAGYEVETPFLRAALVDAGLTMPFLASDGAFLAATIDDSGGTAEGIYVSAFGPSPKAVADPNWIKQYQAVEYRNPDTYSINGYSAMEVLAEGVRKAGGLGGTQVADAIRSLSGVKTPMGDLSYDAVGDLREQRIYIYKVEAGDWVQVYP